MTFTHYKNSDDLCRWMAQRTGGVCMLSFSCGKDAVGSWVMLKKHFHTIIPVYYYLIPKLSFVEKSLTYYENFFGEKIIRVPNPNLIRMLNAGTYQTPANNRIIASFDFPFISFDDVFDFVKEDLDLPKVTWVAIGNRMFDNLNRYGSIKKYGAHNEKRKTFYPIYDYKIADLVHLLQQEQVKLPVDYRIWGKSFDGLDHRFIKPLKEFFPDDYEKIKSFFPLIESDLLRYGKR